MCAYHSLCIWLPYNIWKAYTLPVNLTARYPSHESKPMNDGGCNFHCYVCVVFLSLLDSNMQCATCSLLLKASTCTTDTSSAPRTIWKSLAPVVIPAGISWREMPFQRWETHTTNIASSVRSAGKTDLSHAFGRRYSSIVFA